MGDLQTLLRVMLGRWID